MSLAIEGLDELLRLALIHCGQEEVTCGSMGRTKPETWHVVSSLLFLSLPLGNLNLYPFATIKLTLNTVLF